MLQEEKESKFFMFRTDSRFEPFRAPSTSDAREVVGQVIRQLQNYEVRKELRQRARRAKDQATFEQTVTALVSDLCYHYCLDPERKVSISLSKQQIGRKSRYTPKVMGKTLPDILGHLSSPELAFIEMDKGHKYLDRQTTIHAGKRLVTLIREQGLDESDFDKGGTSELILLREEHEGGKKGKLLEYDDTPDTLKYRKEMERINAWLAEADITFDTTQCYPKEPVDPRSRTLRRIFNNGSFTEGGRLYGGFWQPLSKAERSKGIRIGGQSTKSLDYSQVCPRILYGKAKATPPGEDIYTIRQFLGYREGVKKVLNSLLHAKEPLKRAPMGTRPLLPKKAKMDDMVRWIAEAHPALKPYFCTGIGMELMFLESQILVEVLLTLADHKVVALPVHDAVVISIDDVEDAYSVMVEVFKKHTGLDGVVTVESE